MAKNAIALAAALLLSAGLAQAGVITDTGANAYWGGNDHNYGDVIGRSIYNVHSAEIGRAGELLNIRINTSFAGHAGADTWAATKGIGYGDVFLAPNWAPFGADAHHVGDNAAKGTRWTYGLHLDNRWSNTGGSFILYRLDGATNAANILNSESFLTCALGTACYYREGQATAVKTASASVVNTGVTGKWTVAADKSLSFSLNVAGTGLDGYDKMALHWGETCQNDVVEGLTFVPEPGSLALFGLGLFGFMLRRRRA